MQLLRNITWSKIGIFSLGGSTVIIGYLYFRRRYPKYETIEPAPKKIESVAEAKDELVRLLLPSRLCSIHAGIGTALSFAYFSYIKIECALKASCAYFVASQISKIKMLDFEVSWWPVSQGQDALTCGEIVELVIKLSTTSYLIQQAFRDLFPALGAVAVSTAPCVLDCVWIPRHRLSRIENLIRENFVPELPKLATFISSRKEYFRAALIRDIRSIFAAAKNSEYISQKDLVDELAERMVTRISRYIIKEIGKEAKERLPSYAYRGFNMYATSSHANQLGDRVDKASSEVTIGLVSMYIPLKFRRKDVLLSKSEAESTLSGMGFDMIFDVAVKRFRAILSDRNRIDSFVQDAMDTVGHVSDDISVFFGLL